MSDQNPRPPEPTQPGAPGSYPSGQGAPPRKRSVGKIIAIIAVAVVVLLAAGVGGLILYRQSMVLSEGAVGSCFTNPEFPDPSKRDCADDGAFVKLIGLAAQPSGCADLPGAEFVVTTKGKTYCFSRKDTDPSTAVNGAAVGDCLAVVSDRYRKSACQNGARPILAVLKDQPKTSNDPSSYCESTAGSEFAYGFALSLVTDESNVENTWDRVYCLGPAK